jgi:hypothetical protein
VLHFGLLDDNRKGCRAITDVARLVGISRGCQASRHTFVQAVGTDFDGVLDALDVANCDSARP